MALVFVVACLYCCMFCVYDWFACCLRMLLAGGLLFSFACGLCWVLLFIYTADGAICALFALCLAWLIWCGLALFWFGFAWFGFVDGLLVCIRHEVGWFDVRLLR